jgi:hypothetical protein
VSLTEHRINVARSVIVMSPLRATPWVTVSADWVTESERVPVK